jgi:hypothetical protein
LDQDFDSVRGEAVRKTKTHREKVMKNLNTRLRLVSLLSLILLAWTAAFGQITPSADSYTNSVDPTTNYGTKTLLDVDGATQTTYIQFNLSSIPANYTSAEITKATLKLYVNTVPTAGSFNVDYVNGTWTESTITSSLAPALGTTIAASVPLVTADKNQFILIDVTEAVQAWLSGTANDGIALVANGTTNATFDSKESTSTSHAPELDIVFAGGGTLTGVTTASGSGLTGGGTSGTLNLSLSNSCAANQVLQYNGTSWACAAVGTGTITGVTTSPTSGLTGGGTSGTLNLQINAALIPLLGANNTFTGNETVGTLTADSTGNAIVGTSNSACCSGVTGYNNGTGAAVAVWGQAASTAGGVGVVGATTGTYYFVTNGAVGTEGATNSAPGYGVYGVNSATTGNAVGVYGSSNSTAGYGVEGVVNAPSGAAVYGTNIGATGNAPGVYGTSSAPIGYGVYGTSPGYGVVGNGGGTGVLGTGGDGVVGTGTLNGLVGLAVGESGTSFGIFQGAGAWGDTGGASGGFFGVIATADSNTALLAANADSTGKYPTIEVSNYTASANTHFPVFQTSSPNTYSGSRHCTIDTSANLTCTGVVSGVIQADGGKETAVYAMQSAENWLEDAGSGQLSSGSARIELDPGFARTVNAGVEYHVFLTPNGDSKGLYVSQKTATSFEVHEQGGGTSSIAFDYRIMAKRKGYETVRLEDLTGRFKQPAAPSEKMRRPLPSAATRPDPKPPTPPSVAMHSAKQMPTPPLMPSAAPRPIAPMAVLPKAPPLPHPAALATKPEVNQK